MRMGFLKHGYQRIIEEGRKCKMTHEVLKIKARSFEEQSKRARKEEKKFIGAARWARDHQETDEEQLNYSRFWGLNRYRTVELRREARAVHLARAFLKGRPYREVENIRREDYENIFAFQIFSRVYSLVFTEENSWEEMENNLTTLREWMELEI